MEKKLDLRVQKTLAALTKALYDLMCEKGLDEITVTELCDRAVIRKTTFYKHFGDKTELLVYMIREMQRLSEENNTIGYDPNEPSSFYSGAFRYLLEFIESNEHFVVNVLHSNSWSAVRNILEEQIRRSADEHLRHEDRADVREFHGMLSAIFAGAVVSGGVWWVTQKNRPEKEQIIRQFSEYVGRL